MTDQMTSLRGILQTIRRQMAPRYDATPAGWERNAIGTIIENIDRYDGDIKQAVTAGSALQARQAACKVSGIRKGISDLGILRPDSDRTLIDLIDDADTLATSVCTSGNP